MRTTGAASATTAAPIVLGAAACSVFLGNRPTGVEFADVVIGALAVAAITWSTARARRWAWIALAATANIVAGPAWAVALAALAVLFAVGAVAIDTRSPSLGACVGGMAAIAMLSGTTLPSGVGAAACIAATAAVVFSAFGASNRSRRIIRRAAFVFAAAVSVTGALYAAALAQAKPSVDQGLHSLDLALASARHGDSSTAVRQFDDAAGALRAAKGALDQWWAAPARLVPVVGTNVFAVRSLVRTGATLADAAATTARASDLSALKVTSGKLDIGSLLALRTPLTGVASVLAQSDRRLADVPAAWLAAPVRTRLTTARALVGRALPTARLAADASLSVPDALGANGPRRYLVLFVSPAEARGRFGFIGNFAELEAAAGRLSMTRFGRTTDLEEHGVPLDQRRLKGLSDYLLRYERFGPASTWQNITMGADFPTLAEVARQLYPQSGGDALDGVITIDPAGLAALLTFTGPVTIPHAPMPIQADNAAKYLLSDQYVLFPDTAARIDTLETIARTTFDRLNALSVDNPRILLDTMGRAVRGGHIHVESFTPQVRSVLRRGGLRGELDRPAGDDFLSVTSSNMGGSKIDVFLRRELDYRVRVRGDRLDATLRLTLHNDSPATGLPDYVIGNVIKPLLPGARRVPAGTNRLFLSVYSPWSLESARIDGANTAPDLGRERNVGVNSFFLDIPAKSARTVTLHFVGTLRSTCGYTLVLAPQQLATPDILQLSVNDEKPSPLTLDHDRVTYVAANAGRNC